MFRQKVLHAAERGHAIFIELAYSSKNASLLGKATSSNGFRVPLEHAALANAARYDRYAVARALIDKGLDLNAAYMKVKESFTRSEGHMIDGSPLHNSVAWGNPRTAQLLLENGADVNARKSGCGKTALFDAVEPSGYGVNSPPTDVLDTAKWTAMTRLLLDYGADINIKSDKRESILYAAACGGHMEVLQLLLDAGACDLLEDTTQTDGFTPLMAASCAKHGAVTRMFLEMGADCNRHAANGLDALSLAVELVHPVIDPTPTIEALLEYGADVNGDGQNISPLSWAVYWNNLVAVKLLLMAGADVDKVDPQGATPLETWLALRPGGFLGNDVRTMFRSFSQNPSNPSIEVFRELLEKGANANWPTSNGSTLLIEACSSHGSYDRLRLPAIKELLQHGADVNGRNHNGDTPLITVCSATSLGEAQQIRIISEFMKYKVNTELINHQGETALVKAIGSIAQDLRVVGILLACGADINQTNARGDTPLMTVYADTALPQFWRIELLNLLSRHRANLNHINRRGDSVLTKALRCQESVVIKALLTTNVNVNQASGNGDTPLMLVCESQLSILEKVEIMEILLAKGARIPEGALADVKTFILEVEGRDRVLGSMLRVMTEKERGERRGVDLAF